MMGKYLSRYYDKTHSYQLLNDAIIMTPRDPGPECRLAFGSPDAARSTLKWLINKAQLRKGVQVRANR